MSQDFTTPETFATQPQPQPQLSLEQEQLAQRRAKARLGWIGHATIYTLVISGLALLGWWQGRMWPVGPALGWGLGLAIHGARVYLSDFGLGLGLGLKERMVQRERQRIAAQR